MREIGIQYAAPMVRSILEDRKLVTRRTVKGEIPAGAVRAVFDQWSPGRAHAWRWLDQHGAPIGKPFRCPYGVAGDRLWVREAWRASLAFELTKPSEITAGTPLRYAAGGGDLPAFNAGKHRPGMFMPRWASRITLEVTGVACERLQDITHAQAIAEGIEPVGKRWRHYFFPQDDGEAWEFPVNSFASLWASLNGEESWEANPWVFAISFRRITP